MIGALLSPESNGSFDHLLAAISSLRKTGRRAKLIVFSKQDPQRFCSESATRELRSDVRVGAR